MTANERAVRKVGARVKMFEDGQWVIGIVTGHYDDDTVFVQFDNEPNISRVWIQWLTLLNKKTNVNTKEENIAFRKVWDARSV